MAGGLEFFAILEGDRRRELLELIITTGLTPGEYRIYN